MELLILFVVACIFFAYGVNIGWKAREVHAKKVVAKFEQEVSEKVGEEVKSLIHINIERHNGMFYVYDKRQKTFMAQGTTREELEDALQSRYPGKRFACSEEEMERAGIL